MQLGDSCADWSFVGPLAVGPPPISNVQVGSLEPLCYGGMPCPALMRGGGARSCLNLIYHALLTPMGGLTPSE